MMPVMKFVIPPGSIARIVVQEKVDGEYLDLLEWKANGRAGEVIGTDYQSITLVIGYDN